MSFALTDVPRVANIPFFIAGHAQGEVARSIKPVVSKSFGIFNWFDVRGANFLKNSLILCFIIDYLRVNIHLVIRCPELIMVCRQGIFLKLVLVVDVLFLQVDKELDGVIEPFKELVPHSKDQGLKNHIVFA